MILRIKKLDKDAKIPSYAHEGDAGMDFYALQDSIIKAGTSCRIKTGIAIELPAGYVSLVWDKSGLATNHALKTMGGVIDSGYRGEYTIGLINLGDKDYLVKKGDKVAQVLIQKVERPQIEIVNELTQTSRGSNGFGSTGK